MLLNKSEAVTAFDLAISSLVSISIGRGISFILFSVLVLVTVISPNSTAAGINLINLKVIESLISNRNLLS